MKKILIALFLLVAVSTAQADWMGYYTTSDNIRVPLISIDTLGRDLAPDSIHLIVHYHDEATANSASYTARFATAGAGSSIIDSTTLGGKTYYYFFDAVADIDNGEGDGNYACELAFFVQGEPHHKSFSFAIGSDTNQVDLSNYDGATPLTTADNIGINWGDVSNPTTTVNLTQTTIDSVREVGVKDTNVVDLSNYDGATPLVVGDNIGINWGDVTNPGATVNLAATTVNAVTGATVTGASADAFDGEDFTDAYWDSVATRSDSGATGSSPWNSTTRDSVLSVIADRGIGLAKFDTASVTVYYGFAIWVDDGASNTNTTVGVDGTLANPVSTLAAARVLADSMNIHRYNILNASSFTLAATYENWVFHDIGHNSTIDLGSQDVDNSVFEELIITGTQGGTGTISLIDCDITDLHDFDGEALYCWLIDSLVMDNNSSAYLGNCYSAVAGNGTPTIDFHVASNNIAFRNYSGGINVVNMSSNDKLSIEGNGQIIVDASCSNAPITARGNFSITDNGSSTVWTYDAVYNKGFVRDTVSGIDVNITQVGGDNIVDNNDGLLEVNVEKWKDQVPLDPAVSGAIQSNTYGMNANVVTANAIATGAIGSLELADDITIDKMTFGGLFMDSMWIVNDNGEAVRIQTITDSDHALRIISVGRGIDISAAGTGIYVSSTGGAGVSINAEGNNQSAMELLATGTSSFGLEVAGVGSDYNGEFDSTNFDDTFKYEFWAYNDSAALNLDQGLSQWMQDNLAGGSASIPDSLFDKIDSIRIFVEDSVYASIGFQALTDSPPARYGTIHDKIGDWTGTGNDDLKTILGDYVTRTIMGSADSLMTNLGIKFFGDSSTTTTPFTMQYYLTQYLRSRVDSILTSLGYDATTDAHEKLDKLIGAVGTEPETLIVLSTDDSTQIQSARVVVRTIDQSTVKVDGLTTDVNGKLILELDADSFFVAITANNYTQTLDTIVVAAGGQTDTLWMVLFDPGSPAGDLTRVYGRVQTGGVGIKGVDITAEIPDEYWPIRFGTALIVARRDTTTDSSGDWAIDLEANTDLTTVNEFLSDSTSYWIIEGTLQGEELFRYKVRVADDSTSQLAVPNVD